MNVQLLSDCAPDQPACVDPSMCQQGGACYRMAHGRAEIGDKVRTPTGTYIITDAYLIGAYSGTLPNDHKTKLLPFQSGPDLAQWRYGFENELAGYHDALELDYDARRNLTLAKP